MSASALLNPSGICSQSERILPGVICLFGFAVGFQVPGLVFLSGSGAVGHDSDVDCGATVVDDGDCEVVDAGGAGSDVEGAGFDVEGVGADVELGCGRT
ncbi:hypothetical protein [Nocardia sp. NPDC049149]|uniref:hypothetical protein n=1 Tax=Nocardia sp. NPDC049149 TaxID=3364315 RepID=UPI0037110C78